MTEPQKPKPPRATTRKNTPKKRVPAPKRGLTSAGQVVTDARGGRTRYGDDVKAAARALWEGDPLISKRQVADEMKIPYATVDRWSKGDEGRGEVWSKSTADMSERAHAAANEYKGKLSELGPEITTEQQQQAETDAAEQTAVELRAKVLDRHRKEWDAPRKLSYEAIKDRNFDRAKLAKITAETLKLIQDGERRAWNIDSGPDGASKVTVVIERE